MTALALTALLVITTAPAATAAPAPTPDPDTSVGIRLVDAPLSRQDDPRAHIYIIDHLKPGDTIERRFEVTNYSKSTRDVDLYPAAATVNKAGFTFAEKDRAPNELTSWIKLEQTELTLDPEAHSRLRLKITVPESATTGEHYGVLWAEAETRPNPSANVINVGRAGIRIYLSIGPGGEPPSNFAIDELAGARTDRGDPLVTARIRNTGGRALDLRGELKLTDGPGALSVGPVAVELDTIALGDTRQVRIPLNAVVPDGRWQARLTLVGGRAQREATGTITFGPTRVRSAALRPTTVAAFSGLVTLLAVVLIGGYAYRKRGR